MAEDFSLNSNDAVKIYAELVKARSEELALTGALKILPDTERVKVEKEAKALLPYLRKQMLYQLEDGHPSLAAQVLAEIEGRPAIDETDQSTE